MLTSVGRAAARRVVASANLNLHRSATNALASRSPLVLRPAAAAERSFSLSRWSLLAAKADTASDKKTAAKKSSSAASAKKKAAPKKEKAAKAKKPAVKKPAAKKKAKKVLTPEEQEKLQLKEFKKTALLKEEPTRLPFTSWAIFVAESSPVERARHSDLSEMLRAVRTNYDNLSYSEKERLQAQADANKQASTKARKAWIESLPVEDVYLANSARRHLRRIVKGKRYPKLEDDRLPKMPLNAYATFIKSRGHFGGDSSSAAVFKEMSQEWRDLRDTERNRLLEEYAQKRDAYMKEVNDLRARVLAKKKEAKATAKAAAKASS